MLERITAMRILTRGSGGEIALVTTDLATLRRRATITAEIDARDAGAQVSFRGDQIYYGVYEILSLLTTEQRARFERDDYVVLDDTLELPPAVARFVAKEPRVHVTSSGDVWWSAPDYSGSASGTFETYGLLITNLENQ